MGLRAIIRGMLSQVSARNALFLFVRTHPQLRYYLNLTESFRAANETGLDNSPGPRAASANVVEIHPLPR
jgi:hypothetical protein